MSCVLPIIPVDLYQHESYERVAEALESLESVFNQIIGAVSARVSECNFRVENISGRVTQARQRVSELAGTTRAIQILSCPEYPKFPRWSDQLIPRQPKPPKHHPTVHETEEPGASPSGSIHDISTVTSVYQSNQIPTPSFLEQPQCHNEMMLGNMPESLSAVTSLVLFNSDDNPYCIRDVKVPRENQSEFLHHQTLSDLRVPSWQGLRDSLNLESAKPQQMFQSQQETSVILDMPAQLIIPGIADFDDEDDDDEVFNISVFTAKNISTSLESLPPIVTSELPSSSQLPVEPAKLIEDLQPESPVPQRQNPDVNPGIGTESQNARSQLEESNIIGKQKEIEEKKHSERDRPDSENEGSQPLTISVPLPAPLKDEIPPPKSVALPKFENPEARAKLLEDLRVENPMARLHKVDPNPDRTSNRKSAHTELKEKIQERYIEIHRPAIDRRPKEKDKSESDSSSSEREVASPALSLPQKDSAPSKGVELPKPENPEARAKLLEDLRSENPMARLRQVDVNDKTVKNPDPQLRERDSGRPPIDPHDLFLVSQSFKDQYKNKSESDWSGSESD